MMAWDSVSHSGQVRYQYWLRYKMGFTTLLLRQSIA